MQNQAKLGVILAIAAYGTWGFAPMYFKLLQSLPAMEILMHRIVWSVLLLLVMILAVKHFGKVRTALKDTKIVLTLLCSGLLLATNWLLFIWAVNNDHLLDASLGYYINPLVNVFLGRMFLAERLRNLQKFAVLLAIIGVSILVISYGKLPWIALVLACSFGIYGLLRKRIGVESMPGLFIESIFMLPFALAFWVFFASPASDLTANSSYDNMLLICAGVITTLPLLWFTGAAKRLQYSTLGFFQYIGPSIMFILAVFLYAEPLDEARLTTFAFVWTALVIYSVDSLKHYRKQKKSAKAQVG